MTTRRWIPALTASLGIALLAACAQSAPSAPTTTRTQLTPPSAQTPAPAPSPQSITLSGTGSKVSDPIHLPMGLIKIAWKAEGQSNFILNGHSAAGTFPLVNIILPNPSSGETAFREISGTDFFLVVQADNASWTITLTRIGA